MSCPGATTKNVPMHLSINLHSIQIPPFLKIINSSLGRPVAHMEKLWSSCEAFLAQAPNVGVRFPVRSNLTQCCLPLLKHQLRVRVAHVVELGVGSSLNVSVCETSIMKVFPLVYLQLF